MKKLLALLMACATMTCVFASCGDTEEENSTSNEPSVSEAATEAETEAATTTEEETTEEETTEEETTTETKSDTEEPSADEADSSNEWITDDTEFTTHAVIEDADKTAFVGMWQGEKVEYDGETLTDVMGLPVYALFQYEFKEDGTVEVGDTITQITGMEVTGITWGVIGENEIEVVNTEQKTSNIFRLEGDYLISDEMGQVSYLAKVDEFTAFDLEAFMNDFSFDETEDSTSDDTTDTSSDSQDSVSVTE